MLWGATGTHVFRFELDQSPVVVAGSPLAEAGYDDVQVLPLVIGFDLLDAPPDRAVLRTHADDDDLDETPQQQAVGDPAVDPGRSQRQEQRRRLPPGLALSRQRRHRPLTWPQLRPAATRSSTFDVKLVFSNSPSLPPRPVKSKRSTATPAAANARETRATPL